MRKSWILKTILMFAVGVLGGAGALAMIAPGTAASVVFFQPLEWSSLSPDEQAILKPLAGKWTTMKTAERERWRTTAEHYRQLSPTEQKRLQKRMQRWAAATPAERQAARSTYKKFKERLPAEKQEAVAAWQTYAATQGALSEADENAMPPAPAADTLAASDGDGTPNHP